MSRMFESLNPKFAFALVSFFLGNLGDGLNIFQGIYLVAIGWNEGSVGIALGTMGFTALIVQTFAGDIIDKTNFDRRGFLSMASVATAFSASAILFVRHGNRDHGLMYSTKVVEGVAGSFIQPCLAALTLATFGPSAFDEVMASNILWGHVGSIVAAVLAGAVGYILYPNIKYSFLVIGFSALLAVGGVRFLPEGDPLMGRGLARNSRVVTDRATATSYGACDNDSDGEEEKKTDSAEEKEGTASPPDDEVVSSYWAVFTDRKTIVLCLTGFFFHFANANVLLVLGELMGGDNDDGTPKRSAIPNTAGAIVLAQFIMSGATYFGDEMTKRGWGRKPLFLAGLLTLPVRCALIILWINAGNAYLLSTQIFDGLGGGFFGLIHPYLVADITYGTGRFNVLMGLTASCFGLGATLSNLIGQMIAEKMGHVASLTASMVLSIVPVLLFSLAMPETMGKRGQGKTSGEAVKKTKPVEVV